MIPDPHKKYRRIAVIIFNLGGPSSMKEVEGFLFNLFYDRFIIPYPKPFRFMLGKLISKLRKKKACEIYQSIGGKSPILDNVMSQGDDLQKLLSEKRHDGDINISYKVFTAMRYSSPFLEDITKNINEFDPHEIVLLPLYPQYSHTTTASFFLHFDHLLKTDKYLKNLRTNIKKISSYHTHHLYISANVDIVSKAIDEYLSQGEDIKYLEILFSAHGLPLDIINNGDPYQVHVEESTYHIMKEIEKKYPNIHHSISYQSRVGPKKWLTPSTSSAIERIGHEKKSVILVPIAFTSENSETVYELDIELKYEAHIHGIKKYIRCQTVSNHSDFIICLSELI